MDASSDIDALTLESKQGTVIIETVFYSVGAWTMIHESRDHIL